MMVKVEPTAVLSGCPYPIPSFLSPLLGCIERKDSLYCAVQGITECLGFSSFVYGMSLAQTHRRDERFYVWATVPDIWMREYDQRSYIEIDPRVSYGWDVLPPPLVWDASIGGGDARVERFLTRAATFGIGSGVAVYLRDDKSKIMVGVNSPKRSLNAQDKGRYCSAIGNVMHLGSLFHWIFVKRFVEQNMLPSQHGHPLSQREIICLQHAAHGMTSVDIAIKLGIAPRTANFHFANLICKLGVLNRQEAVATAVARGIVNVTESPCELPCKGPRRHPRR